MWEKVKLFDICRPKQWKTISTNNLESSGFPVYGANGKIGFYNIYTHEFPTLAITCRGATCGSLHITEPKSYINGNAMALDNLSPTVSIKYLYYSLKTRGFHDVISGSAQPQITREGLEKIEIPLPPLPIQEKIAAILDKADALRRKDQELLKKYDELAQAIFIDMFGDPVKNEKGWEVKRLGELGYLKNGLNYGNNESGKELKVFGVGDFKSNWLFDDYTNLKTLNLDTIVNRSFLLAEGDILFVRSNGNKDLIGRAALLKNINTEITYSGFCIKFTRTSSAVNEYYLIRLLVNSKF